MKWLFFLLFLLSKAIGGEEIDEDFKIDKLRRSIELAMEEHPSQFDLDVTPEPPISEKKTTREKQWYSSKSYQDESSAVSIGKYAFQMNTTENESSQDDQLDALVSLSGEPRVQLSPNALDFGEKQLCVASVLTFEIQTPETTDEIHVMSIVTDDVQFHPAMFRPIHLRAGDSLKVQIIYLPRASGRVEAKAVIRTSLGTLVYPLSGQGVANQFGLNPFTATIPTGARYEPLITITNPSDQMLLVKEIFTTESFLHLSLPNAKGHEGPAIMPQNAGMWEIQPHETRDIISLSFMSRVDGEFNGFVHIKTDRDNMILPVEIIVVAPGLHLSPETVNFGVIAAEDEQHDVAVDISNTADVDLELVGVTIGRADATVSIIMNVPSNIIRAGESIPKMFTLAHDGTKNGTYAGQIKFRCNDTSVTVLSYTARVIRGAITFSPQDALFALSPSEPQNSSVVRNITLTNHFDYPLRLEEAHVLDSEEIKVVEMYPDDWIVQLEFTPSSKRFDIRSYQLELETNATFHQVPLHIHYNKLQVVCPASEKNPEELFTTKGVPIFEYVVDFGPIAMREHRLQKLNLTNPSAATLRIESIAIHLEQFRYTFLNIVPDPSASVEVFKLAMEWHRVHSNLTAIGKLQDRAIRHQLKHAPRQNKKEVKSRAKHDISFDIPPGHTAMLSFRARTMENVEDFEAHAMTIRTRHEVFHIHGKYSSKKGALRYPKGQIRLKPSFAGHLEYFPLELENQFDIPLKIISATIHQRMAQVLLHSTEIPPFETKTVGLITFSPAYGCKKSHSLSDCLLSTAEQFELSAMTDEYITALDITAHEARLEAYITRRRVSKYPFTMSLILQTNIVTTTTLPVLSKMLYPRVVDIARVDFGMTQLGTIAQQYVPVRNLGNLTIAVALAVQKRSKYVFRCKTKETTVLRRENDCMDRWINKMDRNVTNQVYHIPFYARHVVWLRPGEETTLGPIYFHPLGLKEEYSTRIFVRNNYSHIEPVEMTGTGESGRLELISGNMMDVRLIRMNETLVAYHTVKNTGGLPVVVHDPIVLTDSEMAKNVVQLDAMTKSRLEPQETAKFLVRVHASCVFKTLSVPIRLQTDLQENITMALKINMMQVECSEKKMMYWENYNTFGVVLAFMLIGFELVAFLQRMKRTELRKEKKICEEFDPAEKDELMKKILQEVDEQLIMTVDSDFEGEKAKELCQKRDQLAREEPIVLKEMILEEDPILEVSEEEEEVIKEDPIEVEEQPINYLLEKEVEEPVSEEEVYHEEESNDFEDMMNNVNQLLHNASRDVETTTNNISWTDPNGKFQRYVPVLSDMPAARVAPPPGFESVQPTPNWTPPMFPTSCATSRLGRIGSERRHVPPPPGLFENSQLNLNSKRPEWF